VRTTATRATPGRFGHDQALSRAYRWGEGTGWRGSPTTEYFHGDNGAGLGASHRTGWTGIIARAMHLFASTTADQALERGKVASFTRIAPRRVYPGRGCDGEP
jgi:hypothetical protein